MKKVTLSAVQHDLPKYLRAAKKEEIVITRNGKPAGVLIGFESDDAWFEYRLESDPGFQRRIARARRQLRAGKGVRLEDVNLGSK